MGDQLSRIVPASTANAPVSKELQQIRGMPKMAKVTIHEHIEQQLMLWPRQPGFRGKSNFSLRVAPRDQDLKLTGVKNHSHLVHQIADVSAASIIDAGITQASSSGNQCLQQEPHHFTSLLPKSSMRLLKMCTEISGALIKFPTKLTVECEL